MGLVLTMGEGEGFYVDDKRFVVTEITSEDTCRLCADDGTSYDIVDTHKTEILPRVLTRVAFNSSHSNVRIDIDAPISVALATDKNYWNRSTNNLNAGLKSTSAEDQRPFPVPTSVFEPEDMTEEASIDTIRNLLKDDDLNFLTLGAVLAQVRNKKWFGSHSNFREYIEQEHKLSYRKAAYLTKIYTGLKDADIPWNKIRDIGWTKLSIIVGVLTPDNVDEWVSAARSSTTIQLKELVKEGPSISGAPDLSVMSFRVRDEQRIRIRAALDLAREIQNLNDDAEALALISEIYLE